MSNNKQSEELTDITALLPDNRFSRENSNASTGNETLDFLLDCAERGENRGRQRPHSICNVSRILRELNESSFIPQLVSIGPIHREDPKVQEFEWQKERYLNDLLKRCHNSTQKETLDACQKEVNTLIPQIKESYAGNEYCDVMLARMMVIDGCFILEFCFKHAVNENLYLPNKTQNLRIAMDLMLLENQVPFSVLQALFDCSMGNQSFTLSDVLDHSLAPYIQLFRSDLLPEKKSILSSHDHVLGYLHEHYQPVVEEQAGESSNPIHTDASKPVDEEQAAESSNPIHTEASKLVYHSIVELDRSGINFKPHQEDEWSMTIKFQSPRFPCVPWFGSRATLLMPTLVIQDSTEAILRNFIAYEQLCPEHRHCFTSYAVAMDILINTQEDIAKLVESGVLVNRLGSNQEAADMINRICRNMIVTDFRYSREFKQMDKYYKSFWPKHIARLRRLYFSSPWSIIALVAAIILFGLTVVQTIFTIKGK